MISSKADLENIVLTPEEEQIVKLVRKHPGVSLDYQKSHSLHCMGLIYPETKGKDKYGVYRNSDRWRVSDTGKRFIAYRRTELKDIFFKSILCPIVVSLLTNLAIHGLPLLLRLLSAMAQGPPK